MSVVCNMNLTEASAYRGMSIKGKYNGKKHQVYIRLVCDDSNLKECVDLARVSKNILMVEHQGQGDTKAYSLVRNTGVYIGKVFTCGNNFDASELERIIEDVPDYITPIISFPDDFCDLELVWELSKIYPNVRFCGGKLFAIDGVKVGAVGIDILDKVSAKYDDECYMLCGTTDAVECVSFSDLSEIETSAKAETKQKAPVQKRPQISFASIMASGGVVAP